MTVENISIDVKTNAGSAASQLRSLSSALNSVRNAGRSVSSGGTHKSVSSVGKAAKSATSSMSKLFSSIKRIAMYRLLRTAIKEIAQAFQEGLKNAYAFSKTIGGDLATALDSLASSTGQMKNQMGAAWGELLQTIMPVINAIVSAITRLMSALSALFAALGGRMQYMGAGDTAKEWDQATGAAKKYKNTILGFDEINRLNDENGGGGGGGADAGGDFAMLDLPDWAEKIRQAIEDGDWYGAGKALADHLNEIIDAWDAYAAGKALGEKINNVIAFAFGFLKNFNFGNLGKKVAEFFNGIFDTVNWDMLGRTLVRAITGVFDFLIGFLENINLGSIGKAISDFIIGAFDEATMWLGEHDWGEVAQNLSKNIHNFFQNVDWKGIAESVSKFLPKAFSSLSSFISNVDWKQLGSDFFNAVNDTLNGIDFASIAKSFFELLGAALVAAVKFIWGFIEQVGLDIADYFDQFIEFDGNESFLEIGAKILGGILEGIAQALVDVYFWIMDNVVHPIIKAFCDAFGINSPSTVMRDEVGEHVGNGLLEGIAAPILTIYNWLKENIVDPIVNNFKSLFGIESGDSTIFSGFGENIIGGLLSGLKNAWESVTQWFSTAWDGLKTWFEGRSLNLKLSGTTVNDGGYSHFSGNFASGGMPETGSLFVAGEAGPEIVANMGSRTGVMNVDQMEAAVANGNMGVINAIYGMANAIVKAVESIDTDVTLDGQSLADKMYHYNQQAGRRYGVTMVT